MSDPTFRRATRADLPEIVAMLADDPLGATRESPDNLSPYEMAFATIDANPNQVLVVAEQDGAVIGTAQVSIMPGLAHRGLWRAEIEAVRIHAGRRGGGAGEALILHCVELAREHGCGLVQLTSNNTRTDAHRFYERLGFAATHVGFKLDLRGEATRST